MPVSVPTPEQLKRIAAEMHLSLTDSDIASFIALMKPSIEPGTTRAGSRGRRRANSRARPWP